MPEPGTIPDPRMNPNYEDRYGILEMDDGRYVVYDKTDNNLNTRYLPWGWKFEVDATETSDDPYTTYKGQEIYERATEYNFHGPQGHVIRRIQAFICTDPEAVFRGVQNGVGHPHKKQSPAVVP